MLVILHNFPFEVLIRDEIENNHLNGDSDEHISLFAQYNIVDDLYRLDADTYSHFGYLIQILLKDDIFDCFVKVVSVLLCFDAQLLLYSVGEEHQL